MDNSLQQQCFPHCCWLLLCCWSSRLLWLCCVESGQETSWFQYSEPDKLSSRNNWILSILVFFQWFSSIFLLSFEPLCYDEQCCNDHWKSETGTWVKDGWGFQILNQWWTRDFYWTTVKLCQHFPFSPTPDQYQQYCGRDFTGFAYFTIWDYLKETQISSKPTWYLEFILIQFLMRQIWGMLMAIYFPSFERKILSYSLKWKIHEQNMK